MNFFELIVKNMRQRLLSTLLTLLSVVLGTALAIGTIIAYREGDRLFVQSDFGYNHLVGQKGDELRLTLNTVYGLSTPQGLIPWTAYLDMVNKQAANIRWAIPFTVGDYWQGHRIIATPARAIENQDVESFRKDVRAIGESLAKLAPPAQARKDDGTPTESPEQRSARLASFGPTIASALSSLEAMQPRVADMDIEIIRRLRQQTDIVKRQHEAVLKADPSTQPAVLVDAKLQQPTVRSHRYAAPREAGSRLSSRKIRRRRRLPHGRETEAQDRRHLPTPARRRRQRRPQRNVDRRRHPRAHQHVHGRGDLHPPRQRLVHPRPLRGHVRDGQAQTHARRARAGPPDAQGHGQGCRPGRHRGRPRRA
jgi:hypothetical protein